MDLFQREGRLYKYNEKGEKEYWEDDARAAEIRRMKEEIKTNC